LSAEYVPQISVIDPIDPAITRAKEILFRPFDLGRWFVIGFCAWLAGLGESGFNFRFGWREPADQYPFGHQAFEQFKIFIHEHLVIVIAGAVAAFLVVVAVTIVLMWLSSRGRFMFLYCVARNKAEVKNPWRLFRWHGSSLFLFRLVVACIALLIFGALSAAVGAIFLVAGHGGPARAIVVLAAIFAGFFLFVPLALIFALIGKFTKDFVVPIMYIYNCTCTNGWRYFLGLLSSNKARFTLYILFQIVIVMALSVIIVAFACATCCCACFFLAIPYVGTVVILPLLIFQRAYSLVYLRQYGSNFDVFREPQSPPTIPEDQGHP
jgi:hypothetical protein